uniref:Uncharacterized protein n=1 Tax=viral metagenome TaxID=1070528 RepID=A0A6C0KV31_9ZZZZ
MTTVVLSKSSKNDKKYMVEVDGKTVHFGAKGYEDFTMHKDNARYFNYISRHHSRENWGKTGIKTAGFWSRWILWNLPSFSGSVKDTEKRFGIKIIVRK